MKSLEDVEEMKKLRVNRSDRMGTFGGPGPGTQIQPIDKTSSPPFADPLLKPKRYLRRSRTTEEMYSSDENSSSEEYSEEGNPVLTSIKKANPGLLKLEPSEFSKKPSAEERRSSLGFVPKEEKTSKTKSLAKQIRRSLTPDSNTPRDDSSIKPPENKALTNIRARSMLRQQSDPEFLVKLTNSLSNPKKPVKEDPLLESPDLLKESRTGKLQEIENKEVLYKQVDPGHKSITAGTLNGLIVALGTNDSVQDLTYVETFLLTHRYFIDSHELLRILNERYRAMKENNNTKLRLINVLRKWLDTIWEDFRDSELLKKMTNFIAEIEDDKSTLGLGKQWIKPLTKILESRSGKTWAQWRSKEGNTQESGRNNLQNSTYRRRDVISSIEAPEPIIPVCGSSGVGPPGVLTFLDISPIEVARQLTLIDFEIFQKIENKEYIKKAWTREDNEKAPNIVAWIDRFNLTSFWAATEIIMQQTPKARVKSIENFIMVMDEFLTLNNFNGVMEIFTALNMGCIQRLKNTWKSVSPKQINKLKDIEELMSTGQNFSRYRKALSLVSTPVLPFQAVCLSDLVFIEETPDMSENGMINFHKMGLLAKVILSLHQYQAVTYTLAKVDIVYEFLLKPSVVLDEKELYLGSKNCEPPPQEMHAQLGKGKVGPNSPLSSSIKRHK